MKRCLLLVLCVAQAASAAETMRIAVGPEVSSAKISGAEISVGDDKEEAEFSPLHQSVVTVARRGSEIAVDGRVFQVKALRFRSSRPLTVDGTHVRGDVVALIGKRGLQLVNVIAMEDYLAGVLGSEMPKSFPLEALKAQAVAARTYALHKKVEQYGQPFHLGSNVISQVYGGLASEDARTKDAISSTRGLVLTHQLQPVEAYFHASCGGKTETGQVALARSLPYLQAVSCPCKSLPQSEWKLDLPSKVHVVSRSATGRATRVEWKGHVLDAVTFREQMGYSKLKSLWFDVEEKRGATVLHGHGFGHGAGMCQWGAKVLADRGMNFRQILAHYYAGTELQTLY